MSSHGGPPGPADLAAGPAGLAAAADARLSALEVGFDAVARALAQLEDRPPPTCGRCGAVLLDVLVGRRPLGDDPACSPTCAP